MKTLAVLFLLASCKVTSDSEPPRDVTIASHNPIVFIVPCGQPKPPAVAERSP